LLICASRRPSADHRDEGFAELCLDNGAWKCREELTPEARLAAWERDYRAAFESLVAEFGARARFTIVPDVVAGGMLSLDHSRSWLSRLPGLRLVPVQDGMTPALVEPLLGPSVGVFVGGSTEWKWASLPAWADLARRSGCWLHVGRAGSGRMVERCGLAGANSFDTSEPSRYLCKLAGLDNARRQMPIDWGTP
jgi:hypothetical protein